jgi:hypothetical protein
MSNRATNIPKEVLDIPGFAGLTLTVYGKVKASGRQEEMQQGYHVSVNGKPMPPAELPTDQKAAFRKLLEEKFPEHALL